MTIPALLAASESLPVVDIDNTIFLQAILFLLLFVVLNSLLFKPWLEIKERRAKRIGGALADAESLRADARAAEADYEARLARARDAAMTVRSNSRREAEGEEAEIVGAARREASEHVEHNREALATQATQAREELVGRVDALASDIAKQILGRSA